jgi:hypothetical protein
VTESARSWLVIAVCAVLGALAYVYFVKPFVAQQPALDRVLHANSQWSVSLQVYHARGPISAETYRITNDNGAVRMFYSATNRDGSVTKQFDVPLAGPQATFLFEELGVDGIWELDGTPARPHASDVYIVAVHQVLGNEGGSRSFAFSDPRYWATTRAREFELNLGSTLPRRADVSTLASGGRPLRDPRYLRIVTAMQNFGPPSVLEAEALIRSELAAMPTQARAEQVLHARGHTQ